MATMTTKAPAATTAQSTEAAWVAFVESLGANAEQASGVGGNTEAESGFRTTALAVNDGGPGVDAHGLDQWEGGRWTGLQDFAKKAGLDPNSLAAQEGYFKTEITGPYASAWAALLKTTSPSQAALVWSSRYEGNTPASDGLRESYANNIYNDLVAKKPLTLGGKAGAGTTGGTTGTTGTTGTVTGINTAVDLNPGTDLANGIQTVLTDVAKPLETFLINAGLIIFGAILVIIAAVLMANGADADAGGHDAAKAAAL